MKTTEPESPTSALSNAVLIRVDSSTRIGTGHAMRCLSLANQLREKGRVVTFVARAHQGNINRKIKDEGFELLELPASSQDNQNLGDSDYAAWLGVSQEQDQLETLRAIGDRKFEWLVTDHYALDAAWESPMREVARKIMVIDDLANRQHDCDLLLDQNFYHDAQTRYQNLVPPTATCLLGPEYALLRPEFYEARANLRERNGEVKRVLVCMGGSDPDNVTGKVVEALKDKAFSNLSIDVVVGPSNPHASSIESQISGRANFHLLRDAPNMAELMANADFAIGGGGFMTWEREFLNLPSLVFVVAPNQDVSLRDWAALPQCLTKLGSLNDKCGISQSILGSIHGLRHSDTAPTTPAPRLVSKSNLRAAHIMLRGPRIGDWFVRAADSADSEIYWLWANDSEAIHNSFEREYVPWKEHDSWFRASMHSADKLLLIVESTEGPLGQVRLESAGATVEISYSLSRQYRGLGLAQEMLGQALNFARNIFFLDKGTVLSARVKSSNYASIKTFQSMQFIRDKNESETTLVYTLLV